jgi:ADP-ribose pyrophosphatase YjhB (NUDIX family)
MIDEDVTDGPRAAIRAEVAGIVALDAAEAADIGAALAWIDSGAELCRRVKPAVPPQHLVSYFAVVDGDWVLLVDHINAGLWLPPGGHVEPGEHPRETVRREALEELGVEAEFMFEAPVFLTVTQTAGSVERHVDVSLWYVLKGDRRRELAWDRGEFLGVRWFRRDEVPFGRCDPEMGRFLAKLAGQR